MNLLDFIASHKWAMYQPALHVMIEMISKVTDDPISIAKAFHGTSYEKYLTEEGEPKKHALLNNMDYPRVENTYKALQVKNIGILPMIGSVFPRSSSVPTSYGANIKLDHFAHDFNTLLNDDSIDTIIQVYDTPGGEVTGVSESAEMIFQANNKKKIISYVYGMAASAGYWLASASKQIVASNTAEVGSIGVVASYTDFSEYDAKKGIKRHEIVSDLSPNKRPDMSTEEGVNQIRKVVNDLAMVFVGAIAKQQNIAFEDVLKNYGQGKMFVASEALKNGMIDRVTNLNTLIEENLIKETQSFTGGKLMNVEELKEKQPDLYNSIMEESKKKIEAAEKKGFANGQEMIKKEQEAKEKEAKERLSQSQKDLTQSLEGVGVTDSNSNDVPDAANEIFRKQVVASMNAARKM